MLQVCVSAVEPDLFPACVAAGADMLELGNYDAFYDQGITFSAEDVLELTRKTRSLLPEVPLSVTVPHTLDLNQQVRNGLRMSCSICHRVTRVKDRYSMIIMHSVITGCSS